MADVRAGTAPRTSMSACWARGVANEYNSAKNRHRTLMASITQGVVGGLRDQFVTMSDMAAGTCRTDQREIMKRYLR